MATPPVTSCSAGSSIGCARGCDRATRRGASAATSSRCCCRASTWPRRAPWSIASAPRSRSGPPHRSASPPIRSRPMPRRSTRTRTGSSTSRSAGARPPTCRACGWSRPSRTGTSPADFLTRRTVLSVLTDRARIWVQAGGGGDGVVSFRREAHVPRGGADGGDGGRGGDVVLVVDPSLRDLQPFRRRSHFKARRGGHGEGGNRHGATSDDLEIKVPPGTTVVDPEREARWDLTEAGHRAVVARGGSGGRGNKRFTTATRQAPRLAERGLPGDEGWLELRLRLLADAGLIGLPNAGKSSLLATISAARPKVADYPFTTLEPVLGTIEVDDRQLVVADIPGLIEGASAGAGLGHEFLAHVERTRLLVHVLDLAPLDGSDPADNFATIEAEIAEHGAGLAELPRIVALSKADLVPGEVAEAAAAEWR